MYDRHRYSFMYYIHIHMYELFMLDALETLNLIHATDYDNQVCKLIYVNICIYISIHMYDIHTYPFMHNIHIHMYKVIMLDAS
jgi:hypothetical protein